MAYAKYPRVVLACMTFVVHSLIHKLIVICLARKREKYYNYIVLSRAEFFCLCMFVQNYNAMQFTLAIVQTHGGKPNG